MGLFNKKEKKGKVEKESCCSSACCTCGNVEEVVETGSIESIKILGGGCANCNKLEENVKEAMKELGIDCVIDHVKDYGKIAAMGVMSLPALAVNEKVVSYGKVLKKSEAITLLKKISK
jgi:small redox-active disulfide protein 2